MEGRSGSQRQRRSVAGIAVENLALEGFLHLVAGNGGGEDRARPQKNLGVGELAGAVVPDFQFAAGRAGWDESEDSVAATQNGEFFDCIERRVDLVESIADRTQPAELAAAVEVVGKDARDHGRVPFPWIKFLGFSLGRLPSSGSKIREWEFGVAALP
jgi:hypothetical protein